MGPSEGLRNGCGGECWWAADVSDCREVGWSRGGEVCGQRGVILLDQDDGASLWWTIWW